MTGLVIGNYRIIDRLGHGGQGKVYRAMDTMVEREVAIKALRPEIARDPETLERFRTEAVTLAKLNHPGIAQLYTFFRDGDEFFMVMEYVPGRTLEAIIQEQGPMPWQRAVSIAASILDGVGFAHGMGILHRDLKPSNIMVTSDGRVKVMDFGIAQVLGGRKLTREGRVVGTVEYLAPERIRGNPPDERADLYSLGIVLYEMLTGRLPIDASSEYEIMMAQLNEQPPLPREFGIDVPDALVDVLMKSLEKDPERRYPDAATFAGQLRSVAAPVAARPTPTPVPASKVQRFPVRWIALGACAFFLILLASLFVLSRPKEDPWKEARTLTQAAPAPVPAEQRSPSDQPPISFDPTPIPMPTPATPATPSEEPVITAPPPLKAAAEPRRTLQTQAPTQQELTADQRRAVAVALDRTDGPAGGYSGFHPIHLVGLLGALAAGGKLATPEIQQAVEARGVNFKVSPAISATLTDAGAGSSLLRTVAENFRPAAPEPAAVAREQAPQKPQARTIASIRDVRRIFVEKTEGDLDTLIREELQDELGGRIEVAAGLAEADAVMQVQVEQLKGGKLSRAGRMFGLSDKRRVQARVLDAATKRLLWEEKAGDRQIVTGSFVGDSVKRLANRIVTALEEDLNK